MYIRIILRLSYSITFHLFNLWLGKLNLLIMTTVIKMKRMFIVVFLFFLFFFFFFFFFVYSVSVSIFIYNKHIKNNRGELACLHRKQITLDIFIYYYVYYLHLIVYWMINNPLYINFLYQCLRCFCWLCVIFWMRSKIKVTKYRA